MLGITSVTFTSPLGIDPTTETSQNILTTLMSCDLTTFQNELNDQVLGGINTPYLNMLCDTTAPNFSAWMSYLGQYGGNVSSEFHNAYANAYAAYNDISAGFSHLATLISAAFLYNNLSIIRSYLLGYPNVDLTIRPQWYGYLFNHGIVTQFFSSGAWCTVADGSVGMCRWLAWLLTTAAGRAMMIQQVGIFWQTQNRAELTNFINGINLITNQLLTFDERDSLLQTSERTYYITWNLANPHHQAFLASVFADQYLYSQSDFIATFDPTTRSQLYWLTQYNFTPFTFPGPCTAQLVYNLTSSNPRMLLVNLSLGISTVLINGSLSLPIVLAQATTDSSYYAVMDEIFATTPHEPSFSSLFTGMTQGQFQLIANYMLIGMTYSLQTRTADEAKMWQRAQTFLALLSLSNPLSDSMAQQLIGWGVDYLTLQITSLINTVIEAPHLFSLANHQTCQNCSRCLSQTFLYPLLMNYSDADLVTLLHPNINSPTDGWYIVFSQIPDLVDRVVAIPAFSAISQELLADSQVWRAPLPPV